MTPPEKCEELIVALDVPDETAALELVEQLKETAGYFKVGLQLFSSCGPRIVERIQEKGCKVFLDLKLHDIPNTVASAAVEAARLGVQMITLHTLGGEKMLRAAREAVDREVQISGRAGPSLLGVTVLTSMDQGQVETIGLNIRLEDLVLRLARLAAACRLDGVVCSPLELLRFRTSGLGETFFVTPGIRAAGSPPDDQARTMQAGEAIRAGARYLVVGRPIVRAPSPSAAAREIAAQILHAKI